MDNYVVGKPDDLARSVLGEKMEDFTPYDFAVMDTAAFEETPEDLRRIADCSEGWYGIKRVDTGFDSNASSACQLEERELGNRQKRDCKP